MARNTDWQKVQIQGKVFKDQAADKQKAQANSDKYYKYKSDVQAQAHLLKQGTWPTGKHAGTIIADLPVDYLIWAGKELKSKHMKQAANNELLRRYHSGIIKI